MKILWSALLHRATITILDAVTPNMIFAVLDCDLAYNTIF